MQIKDTETNKYNFVDWSRLNIIWSNVKYKMEGIRKLKKSNFMI